MATYIIHLKQTKLFLLPPAVISRKEHLVTCWLQFSWAQWFCSGRRHRLPDQESWGAAGTALRAACTDANHPHTPPPASPSAWSRGRRRDCGCSARLLAVGAGHQEQYQFNQFLLSRFSLFFCKSLRRVKTKLRGEWSADEVWPNFSEYKTEQQWS